MTAIGAAAPPAVRRPHARAGTDRGAAAQQAAAAPAPRVDLVERPRLLQPLSRPGTTLALLIAPVGYGKSTLLAQWDACDSRPFAWVTLQAEDDDPARLPRTLAGALEALGPAMRDALAGTLPAKRRGPALARALTEVLAAAPQPFVLVLDDAHVLERRETIETLGRLVECCGSSATIAIAARRELPLAVARLRVERRLVELRTTDLAFTRSEAASVAAAQGLNLDERGAELLARRTEGWAAGVYLAASAVGADTQPLRSLARFGGDDRLVADYLREQVIADLPVRVIEFLARTSVVERLSGPLCDHLLERRDSAAMLRELSRTQPLVVPLDRTDREYRCQSLLRRVLMSELRRREPDFEAVLHSRASEWYEAHGEPEAALEHAVAAGDLRRAAHLVWESTARLIGFGDATTLRRRLARFSRAEVASSAPLALSTSVLDLASGERASAEHWAAVADRLQREGRRADRVEGLDVALEVMRAAVASDDLVAIRTAAAPGYALAGEDSPWRPFACLVDGVALHLTGDRTAARRTLEEGARRGGALAPAVQVLCLAQLALLAIDDDDWEDAELLAARAQAQTERVGLTEYPVSALVYATSAAVDGHFGRVEACEAHASRASRLLSKLRDFMPWFTAESYIALAWAALRSSDVPRARRLMADAERELRAVPGATVARSWLDVCRAQAEALSSARDGEAEPLTTAELRVLQFLPTHLSFPKIADELYVSTNTVKTHSRAIYRKLEASSRSEAVTHAREAGLLETAQFTFDAR